MEHALERRCLRRIHGARIDTFELIVAIEPVCGIFGGNVAQEDNALGVVTEGTILVEAAGEEAAADATVLVPNPNTFIEADHELLPTEGYGLEGTANYSISTVHDKEAWIVKMQPLPKYVLAKNRSYIKGIFWI